MRSRVWLAGLLAGIAGLLGACGSGAEAGDGGTEPADPTTGQQVTGEQATSAAEAPGEGDAAQDVKITSCEQTGYVPRAGLEVTNSTAELYRYAVTVTISNPNGESTEAYFVEGKLRPGQTVTETIPGSTPVPGEVSCEVSEAKRLPPQ
ncbi:hypothetical protein SacmaDRAFT_3355 [Saccharomonospora marina XMU15]|uniref:Uncharacterized protein n=2 Tax=Saccharomonospora TaxID=1851 RepID=H5XAS6_9PSEU|nr:hypothetical protein SacmaDRAFT_3355 [Saccharomonospora marina XMU15]